MIRNEKMVMERIFTFNICNIWKGSKNSISGNIRYRWKTFFLWLCNRWTEDNNGLTRVATILKQQRKENKNVIVIDNGDLLQDNSAELFNDEPVHPLMRALNDLKYDVFVLGNHEFNFEKAFLERNIKEFKGAVLASNVIKKSDNEGKMKEVDLEYRN